MNDLAEKALEGLDVARLRLRGHPMLSLAGVGFLVGALTVGAGGRATAARPDRPLTSWFGLQDLRSAPVGVAPGAIMLAAVLTLAVLWVAAVWLVTVRDVPVSRVWWVAGAWAAPFVVGPPLMDTSVYSYVAYGRLLRAGHDPYAVGPNALGDSPVVAAIDPAHRGSPTTAGPLGTVLQHLAVSIGNGGLLATVVVWRVIGVLAAVAIARSAAELAALPRLPVRRRPGRPTALVGNPASGPSPTPAAAVALCALNPLLLLYVVSSPHLDAVMAALELAALVAAGQRRWWRALVLATLGGCVAVPGLLAVPLIAGAHWFGRDRTRTWPVVVRDLAVVGLTVAAVVLLQPSSGLAHGVRSQFTGDRTPYSLTGGVEKGLSLVVPVASYDDLAAGGRLTAAAAAACVVGYLLVTLLRRPLPVSVGCALLWVALLAPALHPSYLLWGVLVLLPTARGQARIALVGVSAAACVLAPQGFTGLTVDAVTGAALVAVAAATAAALWLTRPPEPVLAPVPSAAG